MLKKIAAAAFAAGIALLLLAVLVLWARPPEMIRVGANYTAKIVCSNVFLAARDPLEVLRTDVQAPGHPLLRLMRVSVNRRQGEVRAGLFGFIGDGLAQLRPGAGCAVFPGRSRFSAAAAAAAAPTTALAPALAPTLSADAGVGVAAAAAPAQAWPQGDAADTDPSVDPVIGDDTLAGAGMRAMVVVHHGHLIAERYGRGFDRRTPLLGWSMTKSVMAGLLGVLVKDGTLTLERPAGWPTHDGREQITIAALLSMSSGLEWNEGYGTVSDVTRMLYLEPDMAAFAHAKPLIHPVGTVWNYSSGTAMILSRIFQDAAGPAALTQVQRRLFGPLGMTSAIVETDASGTLVGSSYMYATARDWARYGQLLAQDGIWQGSEILPRGYVALMAAPAAASGGEYGRGMVWRSKSDDKFGIPADTFWMVGHDGQYVAVIPSRELVIVRLGLTPAYERYDAEPLVGAVLRALR